MQFEKRQVRLGDIRPSEQNPREDFGDIGALARSIEATGGEPLNPPVVVADGNVYRIVDGERRYRALSSLYGEDREVSALVADTMDEANELVAMLATDDKIQLTEAERARGVQQMLVLGVDEQRIERASRATAGQIRAARKLRGRIDAGVQVTLEQLEAASAFDDEKDVEAVLAAGDGWAGKADSIRRRVEREEAKAEDYDAFGDAGIPVVKEQPEGFTYKDWAHLGLVAAKLEDKEYPAGTVAVWNDRYWDFFAPKGGEDAEPEKTEDENYVTVTVKARGHECSILCREATVATVGADGEPGTSLHVGTFDSKSIRVLAEAALSELLSAGVRAGIPMDAMRIELVYAAVHCGFPEEEERSAIYYDLDIDMDESGRKDEKDE